MDIAGHEPASWTRILDEKMSTAPASAHRAMLATLKKRFLSAFAHNPSDFLSTFAPDFLRIAYSGGTASTSDLEALRPIIGLKGATWPQLDRVMVDGNTVALEGLFNIVLMNASECAALGVVAPEPDAKHLLSARAALFIEFRNGLQVRENAYGATAPTLSRLAPDDKLCEPSACLATL